MYIILTIGKKLYGDYSEIDEAEYQEYKDYFSHPYFKKNNIKLCIIDKDTTLKIDKIISDNISIWYKPKFKIIKHKSLGGI